MYRKIKIQSIMLLSLITAFLIGVVLFLQYNMKQELMNLVINKDKILLVKIYKQTVDEFYDFYESAGKQLLRNSDLLEAIRARDREKIYAISKPFYDELQARNPDFYNMHFHSADNISLLRVHEPTKFGDDLSTFRTIVVETNKTKRTQRGLEAGKHSISIRVVLPIIDRSEHLGSVEFGVKIKYFLEFFQKHYGTQSFYILHNDNLKLLLQHSPNYAKQAAGFSVIDKNNITEDKLPLQDIDPVLHNGKILNISDNLYLSEISKVYTFGDKPIGHICFYIDMDYIFSWLKSYQSLQIAVFALFFLIIFFFIHGTFSHFDTIATNHLTTIEQLSHTDELTKIFNRKKFIEQINNAHERGKRYGDNSSIILFDIDNFKRINDTHGHNSGDEVLRHLARLVAGNIRQTDFFARWGGEEFILLVTQTDAGGTVGLANKLRAKIEAEEFPAVGRVTCSFGVALLDKTVKYETSIHNADVALYHAKKNGKNRVSCFEELQGSERTIG